MGLNKSKGNMYPWITDTWNTVKGKCPHGCTYCYMGQWGEQPPLRLDEKELNTDLGQGKFIFVGSSCDMFADDIPLEWIQKTIAHCAKFDNTYLFQSKNPKWFQTIPVHGVENYKLCTTLETNRVYPEIMKSSPDPIQRMIAFGQIPIEEKYITIEPIMDFDMKSLVDMVHFCKPQQVNIGADSQKKNLPEPDAGKIRELISEIMMFTTVEPKKNLDRILNN